LYYFYVANGWGLGAGGQLAPRASGMQRQSSLQRRNFFGMMLAPAVGLLGIQPVGASPNLDVNNLVAREFSAFPGLFPTIATKLVQRGPFASKAEMYAALDLPEERKRLKQYDKAIKITKKDSELRRYKESQICKYECKGGTSDYRASQIKSVQSDRRY